MHLIIDIRSQDIHDRIGKKNGDNFAELWKKYNPQDTISYIISPHDITRENSIVADSGVFSIFSRKKFAPPWSNQVFRMVNFSPFAPFDRSIPTLTHISSNSDILYPYGVDAGFFARRYHDWLKKQTLSQSQTIIVPHISVGKELVELYGIEEDKMEIIPYVPFGLRPENSLVKNPKYTDSYYIYDGGYGIEANIIGLLTGWEKYKHKYGGTHKLILTGYLWDELGHITQIIRTFDLMESVIYTGTLAEDEYDALYAHAHWWIYTGRYWSGGSRIEYARDHWLPLLLSDIKSLEGYQGIKIHPNHLEELPDALKSLEKEEKWKILVPQWENYMQVYKKLLARGG